MPIIKSHKSWFRRKTERLIAIVRSYCLVAIIGLYSLSPVVALGQATPQPSPVPAQTPAANPTAQTPTGQTPPALAANTQTLALTDALNFAQQRSFTTQQFDARVVGAGARLTGAGRLLNPVASIAAHVGQNTGGTDEDYLISQSFELGDKRRQRVLAARAERESVTLDRQAARNDLVFAVQSAYYEAQRSEAARQLALDALDNARKFAETAQLQFTAGDVAHTQVVRSRIEQSRAEQAVAAAQTERANRFATLRSLTRMEGNSDFTVSPTLPFTLAAYKLEDLQQLALTHRPDLQSALQTLANREALLHGARASSQPDLFVEARHGNIDPTQGGNSLRAGLLFPLYDFGRNRADAASAKAAVSEQEAVISESRRVALLEVETAYRNLQQARLTVEGFRAGRLDNSRELLNMAQIGYNQGATTYLELLDAQQVYRTEQTDYTRALADYNIALAALQRAVGGQLP